MLTTDVFAFAFSLSRAGRRHGRVRLNQPARAQRRVLVALRAERRRRTRRTRRQPQATHARPRPAGWRDSDWDSGRGSKNPAPGELAGSDDDNHDDDDALAGAVRSFLKRAGDGGPCAHARTHLLPLLLLLFPFPIPLPFTYLASARWALRARRAQRPSSGATTLYHYVHVL